LTPLINQTSQKGTPNMLTAPEKIAFVVAVLFSSYLAWVAVWRIVKIIGRGQGQPNWDGLPRRAAVALFNTLAAAAQISAQAAGAHRAR
jgi:hypothetical protein